MDKALFFAELRKSGSGVFGTAISQTQVKGTETILHETRFLKIEEVAYILATAYHETARTMLPVRETLAASDAQAVARLDNAFKAGKLRGVSRPYWRPDAEGKAWFGRGYVQLTHKENYVKASNYLGIDLVKNTDLAMQPDIAARILVRGMLEGWFTGKKLSDYVPGNYEEARRVVNRLDKADLIAGYARSFESALRVAGYQPTASVSSTPEMPDQQSGIFSSFLNLLKGLLK